MIITIIVIAVICNQYNYVLKRSQFKLIVYHITIMIISPCAANFASHALSHSHTLIII